MTAYGNWYLFTWKLSLVNTKNFQAMMDGGWQWKPRYALPPIGDSSAGHTLISGLTFVPGLEPRTVQ